MARQQALSARHLSRGQVWLTRLDPTEGNEIRKTRPCVIVTPNEMNAHLATVIVMPLTSGSRLSRFRIATDFRKVRGLLLGDQIRCVATSRLLKFVGDLDEDRLNEALNVLREMFEE